MLRQVQWNLDLKETEIDSNTIKVWYTWHSLDLTVQKSILKIENQSFTEDLNLLIGILGLES